MVSETLIVGGGLAGGAAATLLARGGLPVRVIEREAGPHDKICGEFLSVEAGHDLAALGLDPMGLGAVAIDRVRLVTHGRTTEARLPFVAHGLSRRIMDEALLEIAAAAGAVVERGVRVTAISGGVAQTSGGERSAARLLVATGKHALRGVEQPEGSTANRYVGFKLHWRLGADAAVRLKDAIELLPFAGGYAGLQLVAPRTANLCLIVRREALAAVGGTWDALLAELMRDDAFASRLADAEPGFARPLTIANLPYGHLGPPPDYSAGAPFRLGDQAAMTASLTGDGMAGALLSARIAADCILSGVSAAEYHIRFRASVQRQVRRAMLLQRITELPLAMRVGSAVIGLRPALLGVLAAATRLPGHPDRERREGTVS